MSSLNEELHEYRKAISNEFRVAQVGTNDEITDQAMKGLYGLVPDALTAVQRVLLNPDSDNAALKAASMVLDRTLGKPGNNVSVEDELTRLIGSLQKAPTGS